MPGDLEDLGEHLVFVLGPAERAVLTIAVDHGDLVLGEGRTPVAGLDEDRLGLAAGEGTFPPGRFPVLHHADGLGHASRREDLVASLALLREVEGLKVTLLLPLAGLGAGVGRVDHDHADDVDLAILLQLVGDLHGEHAAERPPTEQEVDGAVELPSTPEVLAGNGGADGVGVQLAHLGQAAEEDVARLEVRVSDAVDVAVQGAEAVVGVGGAAAVVEEDGGCR